MNIVTNSFFETINIMYIILQSNTTFLMWIELGDN